MDERNYYLGFAYFPGIGPARFAALFQTFGSAKQAWEADLEALHKVIGQKTAEKFVAFRNAFSFAKELSLLAEKKIAFVTLSDSFYPSLLGKIPNAPFVLFYKGNRENLLLQKCIGIVGTRKVSTYGYEVTSMITGQLVERGFVTVSGLALGVDCIVHTQTIAAKGTTIAVLGSGVDLCTPATNISVYNAILDTGGTIISTFPPGTQASLGSFPARNKIIAGLSLGVVVTEGAQDSGALITATYAQKFGRVVFAVPGPITSSLAQGVNTLLQTGAKLVTSGEDITRVILNGSEESFQKVDSRISYQNAKHQKGDSPQEQEIIDMLQLGTLHVDEIVRKIGKKASEIGTILSVMEIKGMIKNDGGNYSLQYAV